MIIIIIIIIVIWLWILLRQSGSQSSCWVDDKRCLNVCDECSWCSRVLILFTAAESTVRLLFIEINAEIASPWNYIWKDCKKNYINQSNFLIHFEAWARLAQQWWVCASLEIYLESINEKLMLAVNCIIWPKERTVQCQIRSSLGQRCAI